MKSLSLKLLALLMLCVFAGCPEDRPDPPPTPNPGTTVDATPIYDVDVVNTYPHDTNAFTQGLVFHDGILYESTGLEGQSSVRTVDLQTGKVLQRFDMDSIYFAEGLALVNDKLYQLTWRSQIGFVYDAKSLKTIDSFTYQGEGWGLASDGSNLIMSNGSSILRIIDPATMQEKSRLVVTIAGNPVERLNELEYVKGEIFANIWTTERIARIDPATGAIKGWIDLAGILPAPDRTENVDVLNGIAYDPQGDRLFVTGKKWPKLFEVKLRLRGQPKVPA